MGLGAAVRAEISSTGNLKKKLVLEHWGPCGMRRMLQGGCRGDAAGGGEKTSQIGKAMDFVPNRAWGGWAAGGRMKCAPGSVLFRFEVFKLQILMRQIVSSIQNSA